MRKWVVIITCVLALGFVNYAIYSKERHLSEGETVFLELAPVDPRSLMQGDYMALRFAIANQARQAAQDRLATTSQLLTFDGHIVVEKNNRHIASFVRLADDSQSDEGELKMQFRIRNGVVKFATNAFFFQEGHASHYESARYGEFKVNAKGELLLVAMRNNELELLGAEL